MSRFTDEGETDNSISSKSDKESTRRHRHRKSSRSSREKSEKRKKTKRREEDRRGDKDRRKERKRRRRQSSHQSDDSSESSKKRDRKKRSKEKKRRRKETENDTTENHEDTAIQFAKALYALLHQFEDMGEQLISMIYRMSSGTMFDLNQVNPPELRVLLTNVFATLQKYGVEQHHQGGSWHWREATQPKADRKRLELLLIQVVRQLLNDVGLTMDAINAFENQQQQQQQQSLDNEHAMAERNKLLEALHNILDTFGKPDANPPIALELSELFDSILQGEAIVLDGIPNETFKVELETLFQRVGLAKMKENVKGEDILVGEVVYSLPEEEGNKDDRSSALNLAGIVRNECQRRVEEAAPSKTRSLIGPTLPTKDSQVPIQDEAVSSSEESEGPAPEGTDQSARRALIQRRRITKEEARELADKRKFEIDVATGKLAASDVKSAIDGREEWMLTPGRHTFLEGIMKKGPTVNRQFKNEKIPSSGAKTAHIDPSVQKEMEELAKAKHQERGPSLFQLHQDKIAKKKAILPGGKEEWKWSRDGDLDKGRRVDKNALRSILGGAEENLKTKFEGSFTSSFM